EQPQRPGPEGNSVWDGFESRGFGGVAQSLAPATRPELGQRQEDVGLRPPAEAALPMEIEVAVGELPVAGQVGPTVALAAAPLPATEENGHVVSEPLRHRSELVVEGRRFVP